MGKEMQMEEMLYTAPEVAKILKTNVNYVYKLHKSGIANGIFKEESKCYNLQTYMKSRGE